MTLATERAAAVHRPTCVVSLDSFPVTTPVLSCMVDLGHDSVTASATVVFAANLSAQTFSQRRQQLAIDLGWNGVTARVFTGVVQTRERSAGQLTNTLTALGRMSLAQVGIYQDFSYANQTGKQIITDQLEQVGILAGNLKLDDEPGGAVTLGTVQAIAVSHGSNPAEIIDRIDNCFGMRTFDTRTGVVRRMRVTGRPSANARVTRSKASPDFFALKRRETIADIRNKVIVEGLPKSDGTSVAAGASAFNPLVPDPPGYVELIVSEDILQSTEQCQTSADIIIQDTNLLREEIEYEIVGDPTCQPGDTEAVVWDDLGWSAATNYRVKHVRHTVTPQGYFTTVTATGGATGGGSEPGEIEVQPDAQFTWRATKRSDHFDIDCTDESTDPDGTISTIAFSNDQTADTSSTTTYHFEVPLSTGTVVVSETVTDNDGLTDNASATIDLTALGGGSDGTPPIGDGTGGGDPTGGVAGSSSVSVFSGTVGGFLGGKLKYVAGDASAYAGWQYAGFDDSGWATPVDACPTIGLVYPPGTGPISYDAGCSLPNGHLLYRYEFTLATGTYSLTDFICAGDDWLFVWINGQLLLNVPGAGGASPAFTQLLVMGTNCLAIQAENTGGGGHNVGFSFRVQG